VAGSYADVAAYRFPWDADGTICWTEVGGTVTLVTSGSDKVKMNNELPADFYVPGVTDGRIGLYFPQLRDVTKVVYYGGTAGVSGGTKIEVSADTTDGVDGTWVDKGTFVKTTNTQDGHRLNFANVNATSVRAVRCHIGYSGGDIDKVTFFHVLGNFTSSTGDRLVVWKSTIDGDVIATPAYLDYGDVARSSVAVKRFRLKNNSITLTANSIVVSVECLSTASPTIPSEYTMSLDGTTYTSTVTVGSINPGQKSVDIYLKQTIGSGDAVGPWAPRIKTVTGSWT